MEQLRGSTRAVALGMDPLGDVIGGPHDQPRPVSSFLPGAGGPMGIEDVAYDSFDTPFLT